MNPKLAILFLVVVISYPVYGHLDAGMDKQIDAYKVDFGYSPAEINTGESTFMVFNLLNTSTGEVIVPKSAWIRITSEKGVVFAGTIHPDPTNFAISYLFPYPDNYEIKVRFNGAEKSLVETDFEVTALGKNSMGIYLLVVILFGVIIAVYFYARKK